MFIYGKTSANAIAVMSYLAANPNRRFLEDTHLAVFAAEGARVATL